MGRHRRLGDTLALTGPGGMYSPQTGPTVTHLLLGDDSALPAISATLEALPTGAVGLALVEVGSPSDEVPMNHPAGLTMRWLHRDLDATPGTALVQAVRDIPPPTTPLQVFAHGERAAIKQLRVILHDEWELPRSNLSLSASWAIGRAEDRFQAEKKEPVGAVFTD